MPTVLRKDGYRFFFFSNEGHEPPHIHIELAEAYAKFWLEPVKLAYTRGFNSNQLSKLRNFIEEIQEYFKQVWHEYFSRN
jgi:hypothetical protein